MPTEKKGVIPTLSVIIPFYDEVAFLPTTIKSIITQGIDGIEVIIVNDNPDNFDKAYFDTLDLPGFVRVVHLTQNMGLPSARNHGIEAARGTYIAFLDADDFYTHLGLSDLLDHAVTTGADIAHGQTIQTGQNRLSGRVLIEERMHFGEKHQGVYVGEEVVKAGFYAPSCWSFVYRADFMRANALRFDIAQRKFEDRLFVIDALLAAKSLAILGKPTHVWRRRAHSITTVKSDFEARNLRIASFEKSVQKWQAVTGSQSRQLVLDEMLGHGFEAISRGSASVFRGSTDDISQEQRRKLQDRYLAVIKAIAPTEAEIRKHFGPGHRRFTSGTTGRLLISQDDIVTLYKAMQDHNLNEIERVLTQVVGSSAPALALKRPKTKSTNRRVIVHFGLHKTASTAIQRQLDHNRNYLRARGVLFPTAGLGMRGNAIPTRAQGLPGQDKLLSAITKGDLTLVDEIAAEADACDCQTIIISVENLSAPNANQARRKTAIQAFVSAMAALGDITPVLFYRRPDRWMESYYRELSSTGLNTGNVTPTEYFLNNQRQLDFGNLVTTIEEVCQTPLRLTSFEDATAKGRNPIIGFLDLCSLGYLSEGMTLIDAPQYPSVDDQHLRLAELVNLLVPNRFDRQSILRDFYRLAPDMGVSAPIFSADERKRIVELFCDSVTDPDLAARLSLPRERWIKEAVQPQPQPGKMLPTDLLDQLTIAAYINGIDGGEAQRLRTEISGLRRRLKETQQSNTRLRNKYRDVVRSRSMRLTRPLRAFTELFR